MELERVKSVFLKKEDPIKSPQPPDKIVDKKREASMGNFPNKKKEGEELASEEGGKRTLTKKDGEGEIIDVINEGMIAEDDEKGTIVDIKV